MNIFPLASDKELNVRWPMICPTLCLHTDHISNILDFKSDNFYYMKPHSVRVHSKIDHVADLTLYLMTIYPIRSVVPIQIREYVFGLKVALIGSVDQGEKEGCPKISNNQKYSAALNQPFGPLFTAGRAPNGRPSFSVRCGPRLISPRIKNRRENCWDYFPSCFAWTWGPQYTENPHCLI